MMSDKYSQGSVKSKKQLDSDRTVWLIWAGMVVITLLALPFVVRQHAIVGAIANMCMTVLSAGR